MPNWDDKITAAILPVEESESMAEIVEFVEHLEIYDLITTRAKSPGRRVPLDSLLKDEGCFYRSHGLRGNAALDAPASFGDAGASQDPVPTLERGNDGQKSGPSHY